ncbi:MAG TPA: hypothetical protein PKD70_00970 [Saprospiraceae bacterium]|nr:hypothetical protein [Saprospiraceae bacterium]
MSGLFFSFEPIPNTMLLMLTMMTASQFFFYLLLLVLGLDVLAGLGIGTLFFLKSSGDRRSNACYGLLLIVFGLTLLHNICIMSGVFERWPQLYFLPIYYTLAFPPLLFWYVKLGLYPNYVLRWSDIKHFLLPAGQLLFFMLLFFMPVEFKSHYGRRFYNPFFGAFEQLIYLSTFFAYLYFAARYVRQKRRHVPDRQALKQVFYMRTLVRVLFVLFCIHIVLVITDFVSFELLNINLRSVKPYAALGALSFAALLLWLCIYGFQVLLWGRRIFGKT